MLVDECSEGGSRKKNKGKANVISANGVIRREKSQAPRMGNKPSATVSQNNAAMLISVEK